MKHSYGNSHKSNDEWYTSRKSAKYFIDFVWDKIKGLKIICPCDSPESEIYKYLKELGADVECCMDMWNTDYSKYDIIVTNPPFSVTSKWVRWLDKWNIKYYIMSAWVTGLGLTVRHSIGYMIDYWHFERYNYLENKGIAVAVTSLTNCDWGEDYVRAKPDINFKKRGVSENYVGKWDGIVTDFLMCNYLKYKWQGRITLRYFGLKDVEDKEKLW